MDDVLVGIRLGREENGQLRDGAALRQAQGPARGLGSSTTEGGVRLKLERVVRVSFEAVVGMGWTCRPVEEIGDPQTKDRHTVSQPP